MRDVVAMDHHRRQLEARSCGEIEGVEPLDETRRAVRLARLDHLHDELAPAQRFAGLAAGVQPCRARMSAAVGVGTHVGRAAEPCDASPGGGRAVALRVDLQGAADEQVAGIVSRHLRQCAVRAQAAIRPDGKDVRARRQVALHAELGAEAIDAFDEASLDRRDQRRMRVQDEMRGDLALESPRGAEGR